MTLVILDVVGDPVLEFRAIGAGGEPLTAHVFSGQCRIGDRPDEKFMAKLSAGRRPERLGFYVPDAGPFRPNYLLSAWAEASLAMTEVSAGDYSKPGPYGVDGVDLQLVDDGKGSGSQWPYLWFTVHGGEPMVIRYRVTVTQPVD
ncbi:MAG: hypothetical protein ABIN79_13775 [Marmoricola sp.]